MSGVDVRGWLREHAHLLRTVDPDDGDDADLEPLRAIVGDARVVAIGESTHRIHEFYQLRHRLTRFLVRELGFTAFVLESGFPEGLTVDAWTMGGPGDRPDRQRDGITYNFGKCDELGEQLDWLRAHRVRFYGLDLSDSSASAGPAVRAVVSYLDTVDPAYAAGLRERLLPLFDYLPADRTGLAWAAPAIQAYQELSAPVRYELTARIGAVAERLQALRLVYSGRSGSEPFEVAYRCAVTARHTDAFLQVFALGDERAGDAVNIRDAAMAETVEWILEREQRIVIGAANGHLQRWPFSAPPVINDPLTMLGQHLARRLDRSMVVIATAFGGGRLALHRPEPGGAPGHTELFTHDLELLDPDSLDELLGSCGMPRFLLDLRRVPATGPVADRFAAVRTIMTGGQATPVDPLVAFDAVVYVDRVTPWHHRLAEFGIRAPEAGA